MKTCLLCNHQEPGLIKSSPDVSYICSACIQKLIRTPSEDLAERYRQAIENRNVRLAYALVSFVPKKLRELHPFKLPKSGKPFRNVSQVSHP